MSLARAEAGQLDLSLSFVAEVIAFVMMIAILGRWVYPRGIAAADARQRQIAEHLAAAESARQEAQQRLEEAEAQLREARGRAAEIIEGGRRIGEQVRREVQERAREEAQRLTDNALREIEAE